MILNKNHYKYEMLQKNACDFKGLAQISKQYIQENNKQNENHLLSKQKMKVGKTWLLI
ncbi:MULTISPECIES: hypothetical protein [Lactococcus]|uniref:hypothetical protein n=1 Tax=Lactococcus TaxID=1357 RepID=UPI002890C0B7|nr:hypothetical protein [Lactococcus lactis]MDT2860748.1 hypothetical protein [Lactococcus lactis]MDT2868926.1 hypothetical protein [Lactococcus lactis]MDT2898688.1 hypothetical protein [Lactococcus lactis]MDT2909682.1 hypothetical protein [Lactococcus lactis]MDT2917314.1 hypothetical protein [Lactococcus lactis]